METAHLSSFVAAIRSRQAMDLAAEAIEGHYSDAKQGRFVGEFADAANALSRRSYREPFVVPEVTRG